MIDGRESDRRLIEVWQDGRARDEISEILVHRHAPRVTRFFQRRGFPDETCYDLTQDVFLRVFRSLPEFRSEASFETWVFQIVRNVWKNALRQSLSQKRAAEEVSLDTDAEHGHVDAADHGSALPSDTQGPLTGALEREKLQYLRRAVTKLPPDLQRLLICQIYHGLKVNEIATLLRIPEGTVKSRLSRARVLLKKELEHLDFF